MTNKPMLSVDRKVIEDILADAREPGTDYMAARKVLRALLDAQHAVCSNGILCQNSKCAECGGSGAYKPAAWERDMDYRPEELGSPETEPAAQHQGEPLMIQAVAVTREDDEGCLVLEWLLEGGISEMEFAGMTLFALPEANELCDEDGSAEIYLSHQPVEQPAPVAPFSDDTVVCRRYQLEQHPGQSFYHYDLKPVYGSVPVTISELITLAEREPVAVVMPERDSFDIDDWAGSFCQEALSFGINQDVFARCVRTAIDRTLAEVARLNWVKQ